MPLTAARGRRFAQGGSRGPAHLQVQWHRMIDVKKRSKEEGCRWDSNARSWNDLRVVLTAAPDMSLCYIGFATPQELNDRGKT
jgi:hypothetical protein